MPSKTSLPSTQYSQLLREIKKLLVRAKARQPDAKIDAYWAIGSHISAQKLSQDAGFAHAIIQDLSADTKLAQRTLYDAIQFSEAYKSAPTGAGISWTHYRVLLRLATKKDRDFYAKLIAAEGWSTRRLEHAIAQGVHDGAQLVEEFLPRPEASEYIYRAELLVVVDGDTLDLDIDLGFGVIRRVRVRLADIDAPEIDTKKARLARNFVISELSGKKTIAVKSHKLDNHGRYVTHLFYASRKISTLECFKSGTYLNDLLIQKKHAIYVP